MQRSASFKLLQQIRWIIALDTLAVANPLLPACPSTTIGGSQNRKGQQAEQQLHWMWHQRRKFQQYEETSPISRRDTGPQETPLLPLHLNKWIWALGSQELQALGFIGLQHIWKKTKNQTAGYQL